MSRRGAKDVAFVSAEELSSLLETAHLLRSPKNAERLLAALGRAKSGKTRPKTVAALHRSWVLAKKDKDQSRAKPGTGSCLFSRSSSRTCAIGSRPISRVALKALDLIEAVMRDPSPPREARTAQTRGRRNVVEAVNSRAPACVFDR